MTKTNVLLAFGRHSGSRKNADNGFFRDSVGSFVEREVSEGGNKTALIYELLNYEIIPSAPKSVEEMRGVVTETDKRRKRQIAKIQSELKWLERKMQGDWKKHRDKGEPFMEVSLNWGFEDLVLDINREHPRQIQHYIEPQNAESAYAYWEGEVAWYDFNQRRMIGYSASVEALANYIKSMIIGQVMRDRDVFSLADKLRRESPQRSIIIPRGTAHVGMKDLFSPDDYDIENADAGYSRDFADDLLSRSYLEEPSEDDLLRYAELQLQYMARITSPTANLKRLGLALFKGVDYATQRLEVEAKNYVTNAFGVK